MRPDEDTYDFEGKVEFTTAKAYLVIPTMGPAQVWVPKSQVVNMTDPDGDGNRVFTVTEWWWKKQKDMT
jgi:hypothetical protein